MSATPAEHVDHLKVVVVKGGEEIIKTVIKMPTDEGELEAFNFLLDRVVEDVRNEAKV